MMASDSRKYDSVSKSECAWYGSNSITARDSREYDSGKYLRVCVTVQ